MEKSQLNFFKLRNAFQKVVLMVLKAFSNFKWKILIWSKEGCHTQTEISSYRGTNLLFYYSLAQWGPTHDWGYEVSQGQEQVTYSNKYQFI